MCNLMIPKPGIFKIASRIFIHACKRYSTSCFVTTPIFYVNAAPHIGHLYSALLADAFHRFYLLKHPNKNSIFSTGTDEHGLKVQQATGSSNLLDVKQYCDQISSKYKTLFDQFGIEYTHYIRTTDDHHTAAVQQFWNLLKAKDFIYLGNYAGWYCVSDEMFLTETQIEKTTDKYGKEVRISALSGHVVEWNEEENFMFKLNKVKPDLLNWLKDENRITPNIFYRTLQGWIEDEKTSFDISVSRPASRIPWGIPVPECPSHTVYVWLDALVNYLSVAGYPNLTAWPPSVQVLGKDILKFHGMYWPAFLIAAGLEPPSRLFVHSHWMVNDEKMSKSKNNVIDPLEKMKTYTASGFRYFLLREGVPHNDGNYSETKVQNMLNAELANTLGNLLNRCTGKVINTAQNYPSLNKIEFDKLQAKDETLKHLSDSLCNLEEIISVHYEELNFYKGINEIISTLHLCNKFFAEWEPWNLVKDERNVLKVECILHVTLETLRICGIGLRPIVPDISCQLFKKLNVSREGSCWTAMKPSWHNPLYKANDVSLSKESVILYRKLNK